MTKPGYVEIPILAWEDIIKRQMQAMETAWAFLEAELDVIEWALLARKSPECARAFNAWLDYLEPVFERGRTHD